jgi:hypothetical protein
MDIHFKILKWKWKTLLLITIFFFNVQKKLFYIKIIFSD